MKKRIKKKMEKNTFQHFIAAILQTAIFNPQEIHFSEEDSMELLLSLLEGRWSIAKNWLSTFTVEDAKNFLYVNFSFPYGKLVKRLQNRPLYQIKNSDLALWRDHYLSIGRFSVQDVRDWVNTWCTDDYDD
jgi:hypothetical protein